VSAPRLQLVALRLQYAVETVQQLQCCGRRRTRHAYADYLKRELRELQAEVVSLQLSELDDEPGEQP
jgi:hypothetical protein